MEIAGHELSCNAAQIADIHQDQKHQAFALVGFIFDGGDDVIGPATAKADQHNDL